MDVIYGFVFGVLFISIMNSLGAEQWILFNRLRKTFKNVRLFCRRQKQGFMDDHFHWPPREQGEG